jgi:hypothetical protein
MYNVCYNNKQRRMHNEKRSLHESPELSFNDEAALQIQRLLNEMDRSDKVAMP